MKNCFDKLEAKTLSALQDVPVIDSHTHLTAGRLGARGLHDVLLYHMVVADLYSAGCPSGARLTEFPGWPDKKEAHARLREAIPYLKYIRNTSCYWGMKTILSDLYGWKESVTEKNWEKLDDIIRERADDRAWHREIIRRAGIKKLTTEIARRQGGVDDDIFYYSMEWAFFTRTQHGEFDTALYELERCWGKAPGSPIPHSASHRPETEKTIKTLTDVHAAVDHFIGQLAASPVLSLATHISTDIAFRQVSDKQMSDTLKKRKKAGPEERDIYASYIHELFLRKLEPHADKIVFQFSFAAEPLPYNTASIIPQRAISDLAEIIVRHPKVKFNCFIASRHADQSICTLCRGLPNLSVSGYWWHNFFPGAIRQVMDERLDMLPVNRQVGFFSDAYCIEWTYAKAEIVRNQMARVLAQKIKQGQYSNKEALLIARNILFDSSHEIYGIKI